MTLPNVNHSFSAKMFAPWFFAPAMCCSSKKRGPGVLLKNILKFGVKKHPDACTCALNIHCKIFLPHSPYPCIKTYRSLNPVLSEVGHDEGYYVILYHCKI